ncbi:hypothetical protein CQA09_29300, partial [Klebsiella pneumoniae]
NGVLRGASGGHSDTAAGADLTIITAPLVRGRIPSALEIDIDFNVNVMTGSNGVLRGASGGHSDTAAGADLTIITAPLVRGRIP